MTKKNKKYDYYDSKKVKRERRGYINNILAYLILLIPGLVALIGLNVFLFYSTTNIIISRIVEELNQFVFLINFGLIFYVGFLGLLLALEVSNFRYFKRKINRIQNLVSRLEKVVLQFLTDNKGKAFTSASLINRINYEGSSEGLDGILSHLVEDNKINRTVKDSTLYYSI